ncbi:MAG TPA: PQQ-binding-like beta-propeller repeat protein [Verrucomicrobiae bacterium]|nr:PQQ-binding-like beta-propeller repeat protein [Verrucomicrobiae bacterium]
MKRVRLHTLWFPPLGLWLLWRNHEVRWPRKLLGTVGIALYSTIYAAIVVGLLLLAGMQWEFRGGALPYLTFRKTLPNYEALETSRRAQTKAAPEARTTNSYWTGFRGPNRDGNYTQTPIAPQPRLLWRQPAGGGYASFACGEGRAFTIEQRRQNEVAAAYDIETGRELWAHSWPAEFVEALGGDGPRATPAYDEGRVYFLGALGELRCLTAENGKLLWRKPHEVNLTYGASASPLIVDDKLIVVAEDVIAYEKGKGQQLWKFTGEKPAYSSPMRVTLNGQPQLLVVGKTRAMGLSIEHGKLLWEFPWVVLQGNRNIAQPLILNSNRFFLSAGYGTGCAVVEIAATGAREVWRNKNLKNKFTSSVLWQNHIYGLDEDILVCLDAQTGERRWKDGRYGYGQLLLANGLLIILSGDGDVALVKARPESRQELLRIHAIEGKTWNHPALENGKLLLRNAVEMACFHVGQ